jgi:predicted Na+-dependent transporter
VRARWRRLPAAVLPLALAAALLGLVAPAPGLAARSDLLLAALVLLTALGVPPEAPAALRRRGRLVLALSLGPLAVLAPLAWALSRAFASPVREGLLALGLAPTEVAAAGLVALAGGEAALVLAVVCGSLAASAVAGPLLLATLGDAPGADPLPLAARFALVVLAPLAIGLLTRARVPRLAAGDDDLAAAATVVLALLVYASLGATDLGGLGSAAAGAGAFLAATAAVAVVAVRLLGRPDRPAAALAIALRDFAVASALAGQAYGAAAAGVAGVYGVLMLVAGAAVATWLRRDAPSPAPEEPDPPRRRPRRSR